jgi:transposase, IS5 family
MKRRAAIEPVVGLFKKEHRWDPNYLAHSNDDAINAILAATGYNFRLLFNWPDDPLHLYSMLLFNLRKIAQA